MPRSSGPSSKERRRSIRAVVAFAALMHALERGQRSKASEARLILERLGVVVRFGKPGSTNRKAVRHG